MGVIFMDIFIAFAAGTGLGMVIGVFLMGIAVAVGRTRDNETE